MPRPGIDAENNCDNEREESEHADQQGFQGTLAEPLTQRGPSLGFFGHLGLAAGFDLVLLRHQNACPIET